MLKILFQGDSITDCDRKKRREDSLGEGYAKKVAEAVGILYPKTEIEFINRGISGNRVGDLFDRYEEDILAIKPDIISILIGINDTWRRYDSNDETLPVDFKHIYNTLLSDIKRDLPDTKIIIMEPFLLNSVPERILWREDLDPKIGIVRELARKYADAYIATDGLLLQYIVSGYTDEEIAADSVHPTDIGHALIAREYLKVLGELGVFSS